jgi:hypothetical protein
MPIRCASTAQSRMPRLQGLFTRLEWMTLRREPRSALSMPSKTALRAKRSARILKGSRALEQPSPRTAHGANVVV